MNNVHHHDFGNVLQDQEELDANHQSRASSSLQSGGGNGTGGGMETRVARLESDVEHIKNDVAEIKIDVRDMKQDIQKIAISVTRIEAVLDSKVSWKGLFTATLAIIAAIPTIILLAPWIGRLLQ